MSAPASYCAKAISLPLSGKLNPEKSGGTVAYLTSTVHSGQAAATPATNPASNF